MSKKASTIGFLGQMQQSEAGTPGAQAGGPRVLTGEMAQRVVEQLAKAQVKAQRKALAYWVAFVLLVGLTATAIHFGHLDVAAVTGLFSLDALIQSHKG